MNERKKQLTELLKVYGSLLLKYEDQPNDDLLLMINKTRRQLRKLEGCEGCKDLYEEFDKNMTLH